MNRRIISGILLYVVLILASVILIIPFLSLLSTSFKTFEDAVTNMGSLWPEQFTFDN